MDGMQKQRGSVIVESTFATILFAVLLLFFAFLYQTLNLKSTQLIDGASAVRAAQIGQRDKCYSVVDETFDTESVLRFNIADRIGFDRVELPLQLVAFVGPCPGEKLSRWHHPDNYIREVQPPP